MDDLEHWIRLAAIPSMDRLKHQQWAEPVSYTHLTLPTIYSV